MSNKDKLTETIIAAIATHIYASGIETVAPALFACLQTIIDIASNSSEDKFLNYLKDSLIFLLNSLPEEMFIAEEEDIN